MQQSQTLTAADVLRVDKAMLNMIKESKAFAAEKARIKAAVEAVWFECDCCGKARRTGNMWCAESTNWGCDIRACEECYKRSGPPEGVVTRPWPEGLEWECIDVRYPHVAHGDQIIDQDRFHDRLHRDVAAAIPEEILRWGYEAGSEMPVDEYMVVHFSPFRKLKGRTMDIVQQRIQFVLTGCGCTAPIDWAKPLPSLAAAIDTAVGERILSAEFVQWAEGVIADVSVPAWRRVMEVENAMADIERDECTKAGLPKGYDGVLQFRAINRFVYETDGGGARRESDFLAMAARLEIRKKLMCIRGAGEGGADEEP